MYKSLLSPAPCTVIYSPPAPLPHSLERTVRARLQSKHLQRILLTTGEFRKPLMAWKMPPPMAPMVKAPPQSSTILQGLERKTEMKILNLIMLNHVSEWGGSSTLALLWLGGRWSLVVVLAHIQLSEQAATKKQEYYSKTNSTFARVSWPTSLEWEVPNIQKCLNSSHKAERHTSIMENSCRIPALPYLHSENSFKFPDLILLLTYRKLRQQIP